jgi:hypothetical protein
VLLDPEAQNDSRRRTTSTPEPRRVARARWSSTPEDRKTAGANEEPENDQRHAEEELALKELHDPRDDEDYGDDPQDESHASPHQFHGLRANRYR